MGLVNLYLGSGFCPLHLKGILLTEIIYLGGVEGGRCLLRVAFVIDYIIVTT